MRANNINKLYDKQSVLKDVNLTFEKNGIVFVLGDSGSGKSTLLNTLGLLDDDYSGEVEFEADHPLKTKKDRTNARKRHIAFVFQEYNLINSLTVKENIETSVAISGNELDNDEYDKIINMFGIRELEDRDVSTLSGGEKQRTAIARALLRNNEIVFADEPTGNLDEKNSKIIFDSLKSISKNRLVIVVSHNKEMAEKYADRIISIKDGIIADDSDRGYKDNSELILRDASSKNTKPKKWIRKVSLRGFKMRKFKLIPSMITILISLLCVGLVCGIFSATNNIISSTSTDVLEADKIIIREGSADLSLIPEETSKIFLNYKNVKKALAMFDGMIMVEDHDGAICVETSVVDLSEFFQNRIKLKSGRMILTDGEVCINEDMANHFFGGIDNAVGRTLLVSGSDEKLTVVGVTQQRKSEDGQRYQITATDACSRKMTKLNISKGRCSAYTNGAYLSASVGIIPIDDNANLKMVYGKLPEKENEVVLDISSVNTVLYSLAYEKVSNSEIRSGEAAEIIEQELFSKNFSIIFAMQYNLSSVKVVGICETPDNAENPEIAFYAPKENLDSMIDNATNGITLYLDDYSDSAVDEITKLAEENDCNVFYEARDIQSIFEGVFGVIGIGVGIVALIIIIISCVLVSQITKSNITDRTYEIGVLKSLGAEKSEIFKMFIFENFIIGLICSLSAIIILFALSLAGISSWAAIDGISFYCLEWWHTVVILAVGLIITILSGLNKIRKASNMSVTDAIRTKNI